MGKGILVGDDIDKAINSVFSYLDTIDLSSYLSEFKYRTVRELMDKLDGDYPYEDEYSVMLFDAIAEDEFTDYLNLKYHTKIREETISYYYIY